MSFLEEEEKSLAAFRQTLKKMSRLSPEELCRHELPNGGFSGAEPLYEILIDTAKDTMRLDLSAVPFQVLIDANSHFTFFFAKLTKILETSPQEFSDAKSVKMQEELLHQWRNNFQPTLNLLFSSATRESAIRKVVEKVDIQMKEASNLTNNLNDLQKQIKNEFDRTESNFEVLRDKSSAQIKQIENLMADLGVAAYAKRFQTEATVWNRTGKNWLKTAIGFAVCLIAFAFVYGPPQDINDLHVAVNWGTNRFLALSIFSVGIFISLRNYSACRHNCILNRHRQNALMTFDVFNKGAADPETKKAVLLQAMQAIFAPQPTGYLKAAAEAQSGPQIIEFIKNVVGKEH